MKKDESLDGNEQMLVKNVNMLMVKTGLADAESDRDRSLKSVASSIVTEDIIKSNIHLKSELIQRPILHRILLITIFLAVLIVGILRQVVNSSFQTYTTDFENDLGKQKILKSASFLFKDAVKLDLIRNNILPSFLGFEIKAVNKPIYEY